MKFQKLNCQILAICNDHPKAVSRFWHLEAIPFDGLIDPGGKVLSLYGQRLNLLKLGRMPAAVIVDQAGCIRYAYYGNSMRDTVGAESLLTELRKLDSGN